MLGIFKNWSPSQLSCCSQITLGHTSEMLARPEAIAPSFEFSVVWWLSIEDNAFYLYCFSLLITQHLIIKKYRKMLFIHVIYPCIVFQPWPTVYTLLSAAETTVPRYFFCQVEFCYILGIVGFCRQVDGKRREETTFLLSSCPQHYLTNYVSWS